MASFEEGRPQAAGRRTVFASKVSLGLVAAVALAFGAVVLDALVWDDPAAWVVGAVMALLLRLLLLPCRYVFMPDHLLVRCGVRCWEIPYQDIKAVFPSFSPAPAPALSLHRLEIRHGSKTIFVSPRQQALFLETLGQQVRKHQPWL